MKLFDLEFCINSFWWGVENIISYSNDHKRSKIMVIQLS